MNGGHQTVYDAELVVEHLSDGSEAVGRARCVRDELLACISIGVDTAYEHRGSILRRSRHYDILGTGGDVGLSLLLGKEQTGRLDDVLGLYLVPFEVCGVLLCRYADCLAVDDQQVLLGIIVYRTVETTVHSVVLQHVGKVVYRAEIVDADDVILVGLRACGTEYHTADTSETVDTNFDL